MARISLWKNDQKGLDFQWFDRHAREMFTMGGVDSYVHLYLGAANPNVTMDATQPTYPNLSAQNIQDLLFQENRDRKYGVDIYRLRCHYSVADLDLDLSQFGLMIASGTLYITFHTKDMVDTLGRKLMSGDVLELPNMKEFYSLDESIPVALKRFYVVQEGTRPQVGWSPTWWSHLWRVKCTPMVDSQEYADILNQIVTGSDGSPILVNGNTTTYGNIISSDSIYQTINDAIVTQAGVEVPQSGYNTQALWSPMFVNGDPSQGCIPANASPQQRFTGYLVNDGSALNGYPVTANNSFPSNPTTGDYVLRTDYFPSRLYRWSGVFWQYVSTEQRNNLTPGLSQAINSSFVNNANTFVNATGNTIPVLQTISNLLRPDEGGFE
jgi:hypothetical protein